MTDSTDLLMWASEYVGRKWSLVALHHVIVDGMGTAHCTCRAGANCKNAGKHPRDNGWQNGAGDSPMRWQQGRANIGIRTGKASGHWVLDFDPDGVTDPACGALLDRLINEGFYPHVRTGGGGNHWRFGLPGFEVRNRQSAGGGGGRTHRLPMGWDIRGEGGQVVAPPSVSGKGAYVELIEDGPYAAPEWLLDLIRPQVVDKGVDKGDPPDHMVSTASGALLPGPTGVGGNGAAIGAVEESSRPTDRDTAYATTALYAEIEEYAGLQDGRRGEAAAGFARRLVELANLARWPLLGPGSVYGHFEAAMARAAGNAGGGGYAPHEVPLQWGRAMDHVGDRAAVIPPRYDLLPPPPFPAAGPGSAELNIVDPGRTGGASHGVNGASSAPSTAGAMPGPDQAFGVPPVQLPDPPCPPGVDPRTWLLVCAGERREHADAIRAWRRQAGQPSLESDLVTADRLDEIPDPVPLVDGWLFVDSLARINGKPGQGKSFVAIDLAAHVASGRPWHGHAVRRGSVLYLAAEGLSGVKLRVQAWESAAGVKLGADFALLRRAVQVTDPEWASLVELVRARQPALIVLDTQARITVGLNENHNSDLGKLVLAADALREATGACVLLIHHKGKADDAAGGRGGNAVEGATVSEFDVWKNRSQVSMKTTRQKDIEADAKINFTLVAEDRSAVLSHHVEIVDPSGAGSEVWKSQARALYDIFRAHSGAAGISKADAKTQISTLPLFFEGNTPKYVSTLFSYAWNNLVMRGLVIQHTQSKHFGVHVMEKVGADGVLTPNVGEWEVRDPSGWQTWAPDAVDAGADWSVNIGKTGGKRVSEAVAKMGK